MKVQTGLSISEEVLVQIDDLRGTYTPRSPVIEDLIVLGLESLRHKNSNTHEGQQ